jgi:hypothetical protein
MKTLKDVAKVYKDKALSAINPGVPYSYKTGSSKAFKTGNMYRQIAGANRIETMFTEDRKGKITFKFDFSTPNYAKYVHYGTKKMGKRPFAQIAAQSPEFRKIKDEVMNTKTAELLDDVFANLDKLWKSGGDNLTVS